MIAVERHSGDDHQTQRQIESHPFADALQRLAACGPVLELHGRIQALIERAGLPVVGPDLGAERYLELMQHDKKVVGGRLRLVLFKHIGEAVVSDSAGEDVITAAIEARTRHA